MKKGSANHAASLDKFTASYLPAFCFAQRARCAAAILARPSALMRRRPFLPFFPAEAVDPAGLPGPRRVALLLTPLNAARACCNFAICASISRIMLLVSKSKVPPLSILRNYFRSAARNCAATKYSTAAICNRASRIAKSYSQNKSPLVRAGLGFSPF
jgi:hypothetical protein